MHALRRAAAGIPDIAFFAVFLVYVWAGIDPRLIYHWQGPVFTTIPGFAGEFLIYPGGVADYLYGLIAQAYAFQAWGAIAIAAQVAAVAALTQACLRTLAGRPLPLAYSIPAGLLLYDLNLYYDRTPLALALIIGLAAALAFAHLARRSRSELALTAAFALLLAATWYLGGLAMLFFAPAAVLVGIARRPRVPWWALWLLLAAALPAAVERFRLAWVPASALAWFTDPDVRRVAVCWGLYAFYALAAASALWLARKAPRAARTGWRRLAARAAMALPLLALAALAALSYQRNGRDRRLAALDYASFHEDWPLVLDVARRLEPAEFNSLSRYDINLALYETNRLGDDMFAFPQAGPILLDLRVDPFLPYMIKVTDMCLRLGRVNEAEHFGNVAMVLGKEDPRVYRLLARINMVKGQPAVARKFLTVLSYDLASGAWARERLRELERDPEMARDPRVQDLRRRMLRRDDVLAVWQRADQPSADVERLLLDQLEQDPSNRLAFEFLMGHYLLACDLQGVARLAPRIIDMTGPAYIGPDGRRRTPRLYQEAMSLYALTTGQKPEIEGFEIQPETLRRMEAFRQVMVRSAVKEIAVEAARGEFRNTYFFYFTFGAGGYQ